MTNRVQQDIGAVVDLMKEVEDGPPYYMYGHLAEISNRLVKKSQGDLYNQRYPLVGLRMGDTPEFVKNGIIHYTLNIFIVDYTDKTYNAEQRDANVFDPILEPLYTSFFKQLKDSGLFTWSDFEDYPEHTKVKRYYYGTPSDVRTTANLFNDPLDAIEIVNLKINSEIKNC